MADDQAQGDLGDILLEQGLVAEEQLDSARETMRREGGQLGQTLVDMGAVGADDVLRALARQNGMEFLDLEKTEIQKEALAKVSPTVARIYEVFPVRFEGGTLTVAMANPLNAAAIDDLRFMLNCTVVGAAAPKQSVLDAIERHYGPEAGAQS